MMLAIALAAAMAGASHESTIVPPQVAAAARTIAADSARPASLRKPMPGVRRERFADGWAWIVDGGRMGDSSLCGTGGCVVQLWMGHPRHGIVRRFDDRVIAYTLIGRTSPRPTLRTGHHGSHCGGPGDMACTVTYRWTPDRARPPGRFSRGAAPSS